MPVSCFIFSESSKIISSCISVWALYEEGVYKMNASGTFSEAVISSPPPKALNFREYFDRLYTKKDTNVGQSHLTQS